MASFNTGSQIYENTLNTQKAFHYLYIDQQKVSLYTPKELTTFIFYFKPKA